MQGKRILVVGYGKLGRRVAQELSFQYEVLALKRSQLVSNDAVDLCFADVSDLDQLKTTLSKTAKAGIDYLIYCLSPSDRSEQAYRHAYLIGLKNVLASLPNFKRLKHAIFISSTSVYHQAQGELVDERSPCLPKNFSGKVLLEAESFLDSLPLASTCIRFSGIYGGCRKRLIDQVKQALTEQTSLDLAPGYTNRIHEDDCVGFICHLIGLLDQGQKVEPYYLASDSCPVLREEVYTYIAQQLRLVDSNYADKALIFGTQESNLSARQAGSKRCINKRMLASGYHLIFESYKSGYSQEYLT